MYQTPTKSPEGTRAPAQPVPTAVPFKGYFDIPKGEQFTSCRPSLIKACYGKKREAELLNLFMNEFPKRVKPGESCSIVTVRLGHDDILRIVPFGETSLIKYLKELHAWGYVLSEPYSQTFQVHQAKINEALRTPPDPKKNPCAPQKEPGRRGGRKKSCKNETSEEVKLSSLEDHPLVQALLAEVSLLKLQVVEMKLQIADLQRSAPEMKLSESPDPAYQNAATPDSEFHRFLEDQRESEILPYGCAVAQPGNTEISEELSPSYSQSTAVSNEGGSSALVSHPEHSFIWFDDLVVPSVMVVKLTPEFPHPHFSEQEDKHRSRIADWEIRPYLESQGFTVEVRWEHEGDQALVESHAASSEDDGGFDPFDAENYEAESPTLLETSGEDVKRAEDAITGIPEEINALATRNENVNSSMQNSEKPVVALQAALLPGEPDAIQTSAPTTGASKAPRGQRGKPPENVSEFPVGEPAETGQPAKSTETTQGRRRRSDKEVLTSEGAHIITCWDKVRSPKPPLSHSPGLIHTANLLGQKKPLLQVADLHRARRCCFVIKPDIFRDKKHGGVTLQDILEYWERIENLLAQEKNPLGTDQEDNVLDVAGLMGTAPDDRFGSFEEADEDALNEDLAKSVFCVRLHRVGKHRYDQRGYALDFLFGTEEIHTIRFYSYDQWQAIIDANDLAELGTPQFVEALTNVLLGTNVAVEHEEPVAITG